MMSDLVELQREVQFILSEFRLAFLSGLHNNLALRWRQNRFHREEYRNAYEVRREWGRMRRDLVENLLAHADHQPAMRFIAARILLGTGAELVAGLRALHRLDEESGLQLLREIQARQDMWASGTERLTEERAKRRLVRDREFYQLIIEMMDAAEQGKSSSNDKE